jgi:hypothetical protein
MVMVGVCSFTDIAPQVVFELFGLFPHFTEGTYKEDAQQNYARDDDGERNPPGKTDVCLE